MEGWAKGLPPWAAISAVVKGLRLRCRGLFYADQEEGGSGQRTRGKFRCWDRFPIPEIGQFDPGGIQFQLLPVDLQPERNRFAVEIPLRTALFFLADGLT